MIYVNAKDFFSKRLSRSLTFKNVGSWRIIRIIDNKAYELNISKHLKAAELISIFHSWKLHLASDNFFPEQTSSSEPSILINDLQNKETREEYEILDIVDCRKIIRNGLQYKVTYVENWDQWNADSPWQSMSYAHESLFRHVSESNGSAQSVCKLCLD
jgi:hypothetical protein